MATRKTIQNIAAVIGALTVIAAAAQKGFDLDSRAFQKMEDRVHAEKVLQEIDPAKVAAQRVRDSAYQEQTKAARAKRDSALNQLLLIGQAMQEFMVRQDCLNVRLNDQYYINNQKLETLIKEIEEK